MHAAKLSCPHSECMVSQHEIITSLEAMSSQPNVQLSLSCHPFGKWSVVRLVLYIHTIGHQPTVSPHWLVVLPIPLGEAPLAAHVNLIQTQTNRCNNHSSRPLSQLQRSMLCFFVKNEKLSSVGSFLYT